MNNLINTENNCTIKTTTVNKDNNSTIPLNMRGT